MRVALTLDGSRREGRPMKCDACGSELVEGASFCPRCCAATGVPEPGGYEYEAFISYRHVELDRSVAMRVQRFIEGRRLPRGVETPDGRSRLGRCFRDEDELPAADTLPDEIKVALARSRFLVVVCSPEMRESAWVAREVELFASLHGRNRVLLALAEGEPAEAFPPLLATVVEAGEGGEPRERAAEPLAADLRGPSRRRFRAEALRLVAAIAGCGYDELAQRQRARAMRLVAAVTSGVATIAVVFGAFALYQQQRIQANYEASLENQSEYLADEAGSLLDQGYRLQAVQVALHALGEDGSGSRPYLPSARLALEQACQVYPSTYWRPSYTNVEEADIASGGSGLDDSGISVNPDGSSYAVLLDDGSVRVYDAASGDQLMAIACDTQEDGDKVAWYAAQPVGDLVACLRYSMANDEFVSEVVLYDVASGSKVSTIELSHYAYYLEASEDGKRLLVLNCPDYFFEELGASIIDVTAADVLCAQETTVDERGELGSLTVDVSSPYALSSDGSLAVIGCGANLYLLDAQTGELSVAGIDAGDVTSVLVEDDVIYLGAYEKSDGGSKSHIVALDRTSHSLLWDYAEPAVSYSYNRTSYPRVRQLAAVDGASYLVASVGKHLLLLSPSTGEVAADIETDGEVMAARWFTSGDEVNTGLAYVCDGTLYAPMDPFADGRATGAGHEGSTYIGSAASSTMSWGYDPDTGTDYALLLEGVDGNPACLLSGSTASMLWRCDRRNTCPNMVKLDDETSTTIINNSNTVSYVEAPDFVIFSQSDAVSRTATGRYAYSWDSDNHMLTVLDGSSFSHLRSIDLSGLITREDDSLILLYPNNEIDEVVYAPVSNYPDGDRLYAVNLSTGEVEGPVQLDSIVRSGDEAFAYQNDELLLVQEAAEDYRSERRDAWSTRRYSLLHLDARTLEIKGSTALLPEASKSYFSAQGVLGNLLCLYESGSGMVDTYDVAMGELVETELSQCEDFSVTNDFVFNDDCSQLTIFANDTLLTFDATGRKLWEANFSGDENLEGYSSNTLVYLDPDVLFVQDGSGQCFLVRADDGSVLASSNALVGEQYVYKIADAWLGADGKTLYARVDPRGIVVFSLDPEAFGVESHMEGALAVAQDESRALFIDTKVDGEGNYIGCYTLPIYSDEELVAYAKDLVEGHELSAAARRQYHIE